MATNNLTYTLELRLDRVNSALSNLNSTLSRINPKINVGINESAVNGASARMQNTLTRAGAGAGAGFSNAFTSIVSGALAKVSFGGLTSGIRNAVGSYTAFEQSNLALGGAIRATNNRQAEQQKVLKSTTSTLEEKALALGINTSKLYETVSATQQAGNATEGLERRLKQQTRAFEDSLIPLQRSISFKEDEVDRIQSQIDALNQQENAVNKSVRGIDKETSAIEKQINVITKNTEEKIKALRISLGGGQLESEKRKLDLQKNSLEIQRDEAKLGNDFVAVKFKQLEIDKLGEQISLNKNKLEAINLQTEALKGQDDAQIAQLQAQKESLSLKKQEVEAQKDIIAEQKNVLEVQQKEVQNTIKKLNDEIKNNKAKFDIDIEPLKRKIEDIRDSVSSATSGGGTAKVLNQDLAKQIEEASKKAIDLAPTLKIDTAKVDALIGNLVGKFGKTLSKSAITSSVGDIIQAGISDINQVEQLVTRYVETASRSRVGTKDLGQAVNNLSQDFKNQNSVLSQNSGLAENFTDILERGTAELRKQALATGDKATADRIANKQLTEAEERQAQYLGTLYFTNDTLGAYSDSLGRGLLKQSEFNLNIEKSRESIGKGLLPAFNGVLDAINPFLESFASFAEKNPQIVIGIAGVGFALAGLSLALSVATGLMTAFGLTSVAALAPILAPIGFILLAIVGLGLQLYIFYKIWDSNFLGIKDATFNAFNAIKGFYDNNLKPTIDNIGKVFQETLSKITGFFTDNTKSWQEKLGAILGFFVSLPIRLPLLVADAVLKIADYLSKVNWGELWNGLSKGAENAIKGVGDYLGRINWSGLLRGAGNGIMDFFRGVIRGFGSGIPGSEAIINSIIDRIPRFAKGTNYFEGGLARFGEAGRELLRMPNGGMYLANEDTTSYLPRGTRILSNPETERYLRSNSIANNQQYNTNNNQRTQNVSIYSSDSSNRSTSQRFRYAY